MGYEETDILEMVELAKLGSGTVPYEGTLLL
jgi:hypothetical protein